MAEEINSGVRKEGSWNEISEFAEKVLDILQDLDLDEKHVEEYGEWMPKKNEAEREFKEKTAKDATLAHKQVEDKSKGVKEDLGDASKKMAKAGKKAAKKQKPEQEVKEASLDILDLFSAKMVRLTRKLEEVLYSRIMMRFNPYYFDTEEFSADVRRKKNGDYTFDINVPREEPRKNLKKELEDD